MNTSRLKEQSTIGVVGLGYVGLPLVLAFGESKNRVIGFDIDLEKVDSLNQGKSYIRHISSESLSDCIGQGLFEATADFSRVAECDALLLCIPTPLTNNREPDMSYIISTGKMIGPHLQKGQLVVLESTTYPGTTRELLKPLLDDQSGLVAGEDFHLAYSPEREDPGNPNFDTKTIPKVVGGLTSNCAEAAMTLYEKIIEKTVMVRSTEVAETTKLFENIFRSVNIALVNELKLLAHRMDIDVWEVISAASTKPFGFMPFQPGPGLGGHCIPIDPFYLTWKAREYGLSTRFVELAGEINTAMPSYVVERTVEALNEQKKPLNGSRVLVLGVAYKKDVDDLRESPALTIIEKLQESGAEVSYHDPFIPVIPKTRHHNISLESISLNESSLESHDVVLIVTDHSNIDYDFICEKSQLVVDTRNVTSAHLAKGHIYRA